MSSGKHEKAIRSMVCSSFPGNSPNGHTQPVCVQSADEETILFHGNIMLLRCFNQPQNEQGRASCPPSRERNCKHPRSKSCKRVPCLCEMKTTKRGKRQTDGFPSCRATYADMLQNSEQERELASIWCINTPPTLELLLFIPACADHVTKIQR